MLAWLKSHICERGTNHCSCWFDGWFGKDWSSCCQEHDLDYQFQRTVTKQGADTKLRKCLVKKAGKIMAWIMYRGVRTSVGDTAWNKCKKEKEII